VKWMEDIRETSEIRGWFEDAGRGDFLVLAHSGQLEEGRDSRRCSEDGASESKSGLVHIFFVRSAQWRRGGRVLKGGEVIRRC